MYGGKSTMAQSSKSPPVTDRNRLAVIALLGMVSGLPFLLTGSTLMTRFRLEGVEIATIGYFAWVHLPYTFKFLWAPLLDRFSLPWLGRRRGWMLVFQLLLVAGIAVLGLFDPNDNIQLLFVLAVGVAIFSASLDIVIDAYRTEVLEDHERGPGGSYFVTGYRAAMVLAGAGVLVLSDFMPWSSAYFLLAGAMALTILATWVAKPAPQIHGQPKTFREAVVGPVSDLAKRKYFGIVLVFLLFYKLGENIAGQLIHPFLIDVGFEAGTIGLINKGVGMPASIAGTILGGFAVTRFGIHRSLLVFGVLQAVPNLLYGALFQVGPSDSMLTFVVVTDQFCNGLAVAALVVFLMSLCDRRFTAFQYAALSSATAVLGRFVSGWSGVIQTHIGWSWFFALSALAGIPALLVLLILPRDAALPENDGE